LEKRYLGNQPVVMAELSHDLGIKKRRVHHICHKAMRQLCTLLAEGVERPTDFKPE